jgi:hypothetical protein|uniref:J domain-containing protein n=1 Tax=viral metagenome TaxID=1070528 RepID=A0A6C0HXK4_9ZZZZ
MNYSDLDMNIDNYELHDLLDLFHLDYNFNEEDLKKTKKTVLMTHPDKSKLPKEYFLFFTAAYKIIYSIYEFRYKSIKPNGTENIKANKYTTEKDEEREILLTNLKKQPNFNKIFNELFEKYSIKDNETEGGYGDWLKSEEDLDNTRTTMNEMNEKFELKKKKVQSIIVHKEVEEMDSGSGHFELTRDKPDYYSSSLFSSLQYEDLKKAHVESVIPVTQEDYQNRKKFRNVDEMQRYNAEQNSEPLSLKQANEYLNQKKSFQDKNDVSRAFKLAKQDEQARKANVGWMSGFKQLL